MRGSPLFFMEAGPVNINNGEGETLRAEGEGGGDGVFINGVVE
jgi:hypothetical protein